MTAKELFEKLCPSCEQWLNPQQHKAFSGNIRKAIIAPCPHCEANLTWNSARTVCAWLGIFLCFGGFLIFFLLEPPLPILLLLVVTIIWVKSFLERRLVLASAE
jgi:hypothetical protein